MRAVQWVWVGLLSMSAACAVHNDGEPDAGGAGGAGAVGGSAGTGATGGSAGVGATGGSGGVGATGGSGGDAGVGATGGSGGVGATGGSGGVGATGGSGGDAGASATGGSGGVGATGGSGGDAGVGPVCAIDRDKQARSSGNVGKVYYGTLQPSHVGLTPSQVLAIGKIDLETNSVFALCSGTLVTPTWVLTAKHCTDGFVAANVRFSVGHVPSAPDETFTVSQIVEHPSADVALLQLSESVTARVPEVAPIRLFTGSLDNSWLGRVVEAAGYGEAQDMTTGTRYFTAEPIDSFVGDEVWIDGQGQRGVCGGDSGGPLLAQVTDGSIRVIGELHGGDSSCVGVDHYTRVDLYRSWIEQRVGATPATENLPCDALTSEGRCIGETAVYCDNNVIQREACGGGNECGWSDADTGFRCVVPSADPCMGYDSFGECDGDVAQACLGGVVQSVDCEACGLVCTVDPETGADCVMPPADPCENLDFLGRCAGDVAEWCDGGVFKQRDCRIYGETCGWRGNQTGYYCGP